MSGVLVTLRASLALFCDKCPARSFASQGVSIRLQQQRFPKYRERKGEENETTDVNINPNLITIPVALQKRLEKKQRESLTKHVQRLRVIEASRKGTSVRNCFVILIYIAIL